jgi:hypothetical protein
MRVASDDRASSATGIRERCTQPIHDGKASLTSKVVRPTAITISIRVNPRWSDTRLAADRMPVQLPAGRECIRSAGCMVLNGAFDCMATALTEKPLLRPD